MSATLADPLPHPARKPFWGAGLWAVIRRQLRARRSSRDGLAAVGLLIAISILAGVLDLQLYHESFVSDPAGAWADNISPVFAVAGALILLPVAALQGSLAAPKRQEFQQTQMALLTYLRPVELCTGRLICALRPVISALALSLLLTFGLSARWGGLVVAGAHLPELLTAYTLVAAATWMVASVAYLFSLRRGPGRAEFRGGVAGVTIGVLCMAGLFFVNPLVEQMENPVGLIETALTVNPVFAAGAAMKLDLLRTSWVYEHSTAHNYPISTPPAWISGAFFLAMGGVALGLASLMTRRAVANH